MLKQRNKEILLIILLVIIEVTVFIYFGFQKKGMHFDEFFSYFNTNNSVGRQVYDRTWLSYDDMSKDFYVLPNEGFNYPYVITLQGYDVHPPVYYILLHTICSVTPGIFSYWQGLSLNILFVVISSILLYFIIKSLINNVYASFIISLLCAVNPGVVSNVMFIRMYALLTLWITLSIYLHVRMLYLEEFDSLPAKYIVLSAVTAYLGFLTHYFYLVFLFFEEICFLIPKLFAFKKNIKSLIKYYLPIMCAGILGVVSFPQCLGHVNSGYRGVEVKSYMLNMSDFGSRLSFFNSLINKYVFCNQMYLYLIIALLGLVTAYYFTRKKHFEGKSVSVFIQTMLFPVIGYYLVSAKGSLVGDEAMMRYQLPIFALIIACLSLIIYGCIRFVINSKASNIVLLALACSFIVFCTFSLYKKNVYYLYPEQETMKNIAEENKDKTCIYIYNNEKDKYFIWNDAEQLFKYQNVYFINSENRNEIVDEKINNSKELIIYVYSMGQNPDFEYYSDLIKRSDKNVTSYEKLYDGMYASCYKFN